MDKFGVETTKVMRVCPLCGRIPSVVGTVLLCLEHGSEPFEASTRGVESESTGQSDESRHRT